MTTQPEESRPGDRHYAIAQYDKDRERDHYFNAAIGTIWQHEITQGCVLVCNDTDPEEVEALASWREWAVEHSARLVELEEQPDGTLTLKAQVGNSCS